ncbi:HWE histidine kinase domain-containing protein [Tropicimonas sp. S265A]|uniref:HWE histidine kinase domain-containing protein n=1 Tax=Tropicimonas sp. S265A TaxID=3415134 RepID=UPI003C7A754E
MPSNPDAAQDLNVDLTNCDREPIQFLGQVQDFGCLICVSSDWMIAHASTNCDVVLGLDAEELIGQKFVDYFPDEVVHKLRARMQILMQGDSVARIYEIDLFNDGRRFDVAVHQAGRLLTLEFEPRPTDAKPSSADAATVQALIARLKRRQGDLMGFAQDGARSMAALCGMDRVMVYRFEDDDSGTVIGEVCAPGQEPYLGLRYPASDIPKQARALYERNRIRIIQNVDGKTHPIVPAKGPEGDPPDLSMAATRAVSPIHLEYLRNMGVTSSMSVSILRRGKLWGLFACHHTQPLELNHSTRAAVELFGQLFSYELAQMETDREFAEAERARGLHDRLMTQMSGGQTLNAVFSSCEDELKEVIPFDGMVIYSNGVFEARGSTPTEEEFLGLVRFLNTAQTSEILTIDRLEERYPGADSFADRAAGLMAIPISRTPRDYLVLFRREIAQAVTWAGNPEKPVELGPNGIRLTPRKSFDAWKQIVRGKSAPWTSAERRAADALRVTLLEVVVKLTDEANSTRKRAQEQQELLIAELNHRVRNILNLIQGLLSQGRGSAQTLEEYSEVLDRRVHSLARAHDQLTRKDWSWVPLTGLIRTEIDAFLGQNAKRVAISGDTVDLSPTAFTTMALVVHELVTNSAKYGALSDSTGRVDIGIDLGADGSASVTWRESGGPPVQAPTRKGFGTTIIERSVPYELKGDANVTYKVGGVEATFVLPSSHVARATEQDAESTARAPDQIDDVRLAGSVLLVEDNMIIAMDAQDMLMEMGADHVTVCSQVRDALAAIERADYKLAVLDVNLGEELSLPVALRCAENGVPVLLATGYGASPEVLDQFPAAPVCAKPYTAEQLKLAIAKALSI